jgi:dTDP-glucose pyrophosphorylase
MKEYILDRKSSIKDALIKLDKLSGEGVLFIIENDNILLGSISDGDIRRGLLQGFKLEDFALKVANLSPKFIIEKSVDFRAISEFREKKYKVIPIVNSNRKIIRVLNFKENKSYLPFDAIIMAGGKGERLRPLTENTPKPMLKVAEKPIIGHIFDRLVYYGVRDFSISINYLGNQIKDYFSSREIENINLNFIEEKSPLGTIGSVSLIENFNNDYVLLTNSDLLTNLDYEKLFQEFIKSQSDMAIVSIPYEVNIPYAVLEINQGFVQSLKEKPQYTYFSNAGIYLFNKKVLKHIPYNTYFNATDLLEEVIKSGGKVFNFSLNDLWIDVGTHSDFEKANNIFRNLG